MPYIITNAIAMNKDLPLFVAKIEDDAEGIDRISLVKHPAIERGFVAFDRQKPIKFRVNEVQRKIMGPIMIPNMPIYRRDEYGEYYVAYEMDTIEIMMRKYLHDGNRINIEHVFPVAGVELQEMFLKDSARGLSPTSYEDLPDGSLFGTFYVPNADAWQLITSGEVTGFSLEGWFAHALVGNEKQEAERLFRQIKHL